MFPVTCRERSPSASIKLLMKLVFLPDAEFSDFFPRVRPSWEPDRSTASAKKVFFSVCWNYSVSWCPYVNLKDD